jgi:hypothetical protein
MAAPPLEFPISLKEQEVVGGELAGIDIVQV